MHVRRRWARVMVGTLALLVATAGGCASWDRHVFQSTVQRPAIVTVVDAEAGEMLWRLDVPPNHRLTLDLANADEIGVLHTSGKPATHMNWKLHRLGHGSPADANLTRRVNAGRVELDERVVRINVSYHPPARWPDAPQPNDIDDTAETIEAAMADADSRHHTDE